MSKYDVKPEGPQWDELRHLLTDMCESVDADEVNLVQFAKSYESLARAMLEMAQAQGLSSLRFEAAAKTLNLLTPKAALESFLAGP